MRYLLLLLLSAPAAASAASCKDVIAAKDDSVVAYLPKLFAKQKNPEAGEHPIYRLSDKFVAVEFLGVIAKDEVKSQYIHGFRLGFLFPQKPTEEEQELVGSLVSIDDLTLGSIKNQAERFAAIRKSLRSTSALDLWSDPEKLKGELAQAEGSLKINPRDPIQAAHKKALEHARDEKRLSLWVYNRGAFESPLYDKYSALKKKDRESLVELVNEKGTEADVMAAGPSAVSGGKFSAMTVARIHEQIQKLCK